MGKSNVEETIYFKKNITEITCYTDSLLRNFSVKNPFKRNAFVAPALSE